jgi:hypothetical protein
VPETSLYFPIKKKAESLMVAEGGKRTPAAEFAATLYRKVTKANPSTVLYEGTMVSVARIVSALAWLFGPRVIDLLSGGTSGLNDLAKIMKAKEEK